MVKDNGQTKATSEHVERWTQTDFKLLFTLKLNSICCSLTLPN